MGQVSTGVFNWVKLLIENKWLVMMIVGFFTSAYGNVKQQETIDNREKVIGIYAEVAAESTGLSTVQPKIVNDKPCNCQLYIDKHEREYHK